MAFVPQFALPVAVRPEDLDELGHVNNVVYFAWAERIARAHAETMGFGLEACRAAGGVFVARRHEVDYLRSAGPGEELRLVTRLDDVAGVRATRTTEVRREEATLARIVTHWVWIDESTGRPKRIPASLVALAATLDVAALA